jgi:hypothetical protein
MGYRPRSNRASLRRAVVASVALHLVVAGAVVLGVRLTPQGAPRAAAIDTRAGDVVVKMFDEVESIPIAPQPKEPTKPTLSPDPPVEPPAAPVEPPKTPTTKPQPEPARTPHATAVPHALPPDVLNRIRQPRATSLRPPTPTHDPNVKPAANTNAKPPSSTQPIHGAFTRAQSVVYVLDSSGSMGEFGKFAVARAALVTTLRLQPGEVRFQVIAYNTTARPLLPGGCVPASPANVAAAESALAELSAAGRSNHVEAIRRATALRPDVIVILTDAGDLSASAIKPALSAGGKPVVCVARVTANGVSEPRELK